MPFQQSVECCECGVPVGDDGAMRAVLLLPCQHLLHMGCVDYMRKRRKLQELVGNSGSGGDGNVVACPACQAFIHRLVPLYVSGVDAVRLPGLNSTDAVSQFKGLHHGQKTNIAHLRALHEQRERLMQLTRTCALLHERRTDAQAEIDRLSAILPSASLATDVSQLAGDDLCVDGMTATELELYITHTSVILSSLDRDVCEQRRLADKKRKRLEELRLRLRAVTVSLVEGDEDDGDKKRRRLSHGPRANASADDMESSCSEAECDNHRGRRRRHAPVVVDVDLEETCAEDQVMILSSRSSSGAGDDVGSCRHGNTRDKTRNNKTNVDGSDRNDDDDDDDDVVYIGQTTASTSSVGGANGGTSSSSNNNNNNRNNEGSGNNAAPAQQPLLLRAVDAVSGTAECDEDDMVFYNRLQRVIPTLHRVMHTPNATRLLPRRVDRLWQPSLNGLL